MDEEEIIELVSNEMVHANECACYGKATMENCNCYVIEIVKEIKKIYEKYNNYKEAISQIKILNADKDADIKWLCEQSFKEDGE